MSESHSIDAGFDFLSDDDNDRLARGLFGYEALQKRTHRWNRAMEREAGSRASCATISVLFYSSLALIDLICVIQERMDRYNTNDDSFVFLLSTRAGGIGINLVAADTARLLYHHSVQRKDFDIVMAGDFL